MSDTTLPDVEITLSEVLPDEAHEIRRGAVVWTELFRRAFRVMGSLGEEHLEAMQRLRRLVGLIQAHCTVVEGMAAPRITKTVPRELLKTMRADEAREPRRDVFENMRSHVVAHDKTIADRCPSCDRRSLFIGEGGWITCSSLDCKQPGLTDAINMRVQNAIESVGNGNGATSHGPQLGDFQPNEVEVCGNCGTVHLASQVCAYCGRLGALKAEFDQHATKIRELLERSVGGTRA